MRRCVSIFELRLAEGCDGQRPELEKPSDFEQEHEHR
jgi:hypothetical protein